MKVYLAYKIYSDEYELDSAKLFRKRKDAAEYAYSLAKELIEYQDFEYYDPPCTAGNPFEDDSMFEFERSDGLFVTVEVDQMEL